VPRAKYTKPPRFPEQIKGAKFRFRRDQRLKLTRLLPYKFADLKIPFAAEQVATPHRPGHSLETIAAIVIDQTEVLISAYKTQLPYTSEGQFSPRRTLIAVRRLREALEPFVRGSVDAETADIIPEDLDRKLADREKELTEIRVPPGPRRTLALLCQQIAWHVKTVASKFGETVTEGQVLRFVDEALNFAGVKHPDFARHRDRLAALVFSD